jgi:hypothetical protein
MSEHRWARHMLGASAAATAAVSAALERLWDTAQDESASMNTFTCLAYNLPCLLPIQYARFVSGPLANGGDREVDIFRMCQLAADQLRQDCLFEVRLTVQ